MSIFFIVKTIHIIGVALLLGAGSVIAYYKLRADRSKDIRIIACSWSLAMFVRFKILERSCNALSVPWDILEMASYTYSEALPSHTCSSQPSEAHISHSACPFSFGPEGWFDSILGATNMCNRLHKGYCRLQGYRAMGNWNYKTRKISGRSDLDSRAGRRQSLCLCIGPPLSAT